MARFLLLFAAVVLSCAVAAASVLDTPAANGGPVAKYSLIGDEDANTEQQQQHGGNATDTASSTYASKASCTLTKWEGFTSGLLCQGGINGRCMYRVPIGRALTLGANTFSVAFANGHSATIYTSEGQPEPIPRRHSTTLSVDHPSHIHQSDAHLGPFVKATRPLMRLFGLIRRAVKAINNKAGSASADEHQLQMIRENDAVTLGRFKRLDASQQQSTAIAVRVGGYFEDDEEAEGGRRQHSMRLLLDQGVIEVEDVTEGWRTAGAAKSDLCRCEHCACILGLTVRGWRC